MATYNGVGKGNAWVDWLFSLLCRKMNKDDLTAFLGLVCAVPAFSSIHWTRILIVREINGRNSNLGIGRMLPTPRIEKRQKSGKIALKLNCFLTWWILKEGCFPYSTNKIRSFYAKLRITAPGTVFICAMRAYKGEQLRIAVGPCVCSEREGNKTNRKWRKPGGRETHSRTSPIEFLMLNNNNN